MSPVTPDSNGPKSSRRNWTRAEKLTAAGVIVAVVFGLPAYGIFGPGGGTQHPTPPTPSPTPTPTHTPITQPEFLDNIVPAGGTAAPQKGLAVANGQNLPDSLVYNVDWTNAATDTPISVLYDLAGSFRTFTATVGLDQCGFAGLSATFQVRADGKNIVNQNVPEGTNVAISAPVTSTHQLELVITFNSNAGGCAKAVWGRAQVQP